MVLSNSDKSGSDKETSKSQIKVKVKRVAASKSMQIKMKRAKSVSKSNFKERGSLVSLKGNKSARFGKSKTANSKLKSKQEKSDKSGSKKSRSKKKKRKKKKDKSTSRKQAEELGVEVTSESSLDLGSKEPVANLSSMSKELKDLIEKPFQVEITSKEELVPKPSPLPPAQLDQEADEQPHQQDSSAFKWAAVVVGVAAVFAGYYLTRN